MGTIATLGVALIAHHEGFTAGMEKAARSQDLFTANIRSARSVIEATKTSAEVYQDKLTQLEGHLSHGKINLEQYNRALESVKSGYEKATESHHGFEISLESAKTAAETIGLIALGEAALEAGRKVAELVHHTIEAAEQNEKLSRVLQVSTRDLQRLQYAAEITHVGTEALATALEKMEKNLGAAAIEGGAAKDKMQAFGFSVDQLFAMRPAEAFGKIADSIASISSPFERSAAAAEIFGRSGMELLPILERGKAGLDEWSAAADKTHFAMNAIDSRAILEAGESIHKLELALQGVANVVTAAIAPGLANAAQEMDRLGDSGRLTTQTIRNGIRDAVEIGAPLIDIVQGAGAGLYHIGAAIVTITGALNIIVDTAASFVNLITLGMVPGLDKFVVHLRESHDVLGYMHDDLAKSADEMSRLDWSTKAKDAIAAANAAEGHAKAVEHISDAARDTSDAMEGVRRSSARMIDPKMTEDAKVMDEIGAAVERIHDRLIGVQFGHEQAEVMKLTDMYNTLAEAARKRIVASDFNPDVVRNEHLALQPLADQVNAGKQMIQQIAAEEVNKKAIQESARAAEEVTRQEARRAEQLQSLTDKVLAHSKAVGDMSESSNVLRARELGASDATIQWIKDTEHGIKTTEEAAKNLEHLNRTMERSANQHGLVLGQGQAYDPRGRLSGLLDGGSSAPNADSVAAAGAAKIDSAVKGKSDEMVALTRKMQADIEALRRSGMGLVN